MFVSAFQSYLFNLALSRRIDDGYALDDPQPGDRLLFANGRTDTVTAANISAVKIHLKRGRCTHRPLHAGKREVRSKNTDGEQATEALLAESGSRRKILHGHPRLCGQNMKVHGDLLR